MSDHPSNPSSYPSYPAGPGDHQPAPGTPMTRPRPVDLAIKLIWALVALSLVSALVTFFLLDTIVDQVIDDAGLTGSVDADTIRSGAVLGAVVGLVITVGLYALLAFFLGRGANWARIVYTVLAVLGIIASVVGLTSPQPALLLVISVVQLGLTAAIVFLLWQKESTAFFKAR